MENLNNSSKLKSFLVFVLFVLFSIFVVGVSWLYITPSQTVSVAFAYVVGLTMIVLPCTLPLAFVIVPLAMKQNPKKGLIMAVLFGLGISVTLSVYGLFVAGMGKAVGLDNAINQAGLTSRVLFIIGGISAFIFGLSELNLVKFKIPGFSGSHPNWILKQGDYLKSFFLGLFLGNAGVGCPNPLFYVLLADIAVAGNLFSGLWLGFVHGIGRSTPLIFLTILGILGVNAVSKVASKGEVVKKISGWVLVVLGSFILINGLSHQWYENSVVHKGWNKIIQNVAGEGVSEREMHDDSGMNDDEHYEMIVSSLEHEHDLEVPENHGHILANNDEHSENEIEDLVKSPWPPYLLVLLILLPYVWYKLKFKKQRS